ncbi:hypothetical protein PC118_g20686 [Phytophthora cactorum]|nr:hypothetical protein PC111_g19639 [Phytophthora cactorum]KAG2807586.1 hypothetical protein PC112_g17341 [Phytophthora cactorum]KAG2849926.1 hypothetical protein PC113_g17253 [Phytophthora cactorum]KAG2914656.1 hypothetical protein PC117_g18255 [Phytophthora cactorum]KAG2963809.1 hypothetical protein PC118_g20686 [Phytophthora cactorum]
MRWRAIVLMYVYSVETATVATVLGTSVRSLGRWYRRIRKTGNVLKDKPRTRTSRWPSHVCAFIHQYVQDHPCFDFEELRYELQALDTTGINVSDSTICRALRFDLNLTRKALTKRARESMPRECRAARLSPFYSGPDQIVLSTKHPMMEDLCFAATAGRQGTTLLKCRFRGKRVSILAVMGMQGVFGGEIRTALFHV